MKVYFAADHAGFDLKKALMSFVQGELAHEVEDCGAFELDASDDYPEIIACAARALQNDAAQGIESRAVILGGSGQGEAMAANRFKGVRAAAYYGAPPRSQTDAVGKELDMITSTREHNNANVLSLGARFMSEDEAKAAVKTWLESAFSGDARHVKRIQSLDSIA